MSVAPDTVADRVLAIDAAESTDTPLLDRTVDADAAVAAELAPAAIGETPTCPPTVGNHPLVEVILSGLLDLAFSKSFVDLCAVGDACRKLFGVVGETAEFGVDAGE